MAEREKYYIGLNGQIFEVSKELYETYYKGQRKEKYFTHDLKQEHTKVDKETGEMIVIPTSHHSLYYTASHFDYGIKRNCGMGCLPIHKPLFHNLPDFHKYALCPAIY